MNRTKIEAIDVLDNLIIGRVEPRIYAFTTNTVPNYLKVGDTYRPVSQRLNEWRIFFPELEKQYENKAIIDEETYFRDYAIHKFLEHDLEKKRLLPSDLEDCIYYSREFFKDTKTVDIDKAIEDIKNNYDSKTGKYEYYNSKNRLPEIYHYERGQKWDLRPNQAAAVKAFVDAVNNGRKNLLMYAVMRFGKSFTSLCCALEIKASTVLVVSAKADVKDEWKKTVEGAGNFSDYVFLEAYDLASNEKSINEAKTKNKKVVIFLTLQDLQGDEIKDKHKELFKEQIDLLIVDETHFGARAESFGKILENAGYENSDSSNINKLDDENVDTNVADKEIKKINARIRLHLSGTPYRILMGSEFDKEDIISFVQFSDIVKEQQEWDKNNLIRDDVNEWDNPYYGFPQMIRFAFNPNKSSREKMESLKNSGVTYAFSKLFEPKSIKKDAKCGNHKQFINETEILDLLQVIDGSKEDENLLSFLDYDKIKEGKMCRHIVMVLPYCASCDAMEALLLKQRDTFKNLGEYEIINISGLDAGKKYKKTNDIKNKIKKCEDANKKTITLTVNRMLTGSTVEQWDTMLYFKDTSSPQEYDQSIFRLQNQYIRTLSSENGYIKENLKPQTLLVDFDPNRLFRMQEQKSLIYNVNIEENGNSKLKERIAEELRISPVIIMNHNKIKEINATNILEAISEYNNQRSVSDEVLDIPVDLSILNDETIMQIIKEQAEFHSRQGLVIAPSQDEGDNIDIPEVIESGHDYKNNAQGKEKTSDCKLEETDKEIEKLTGQIKTYYQRILFFSFLTKDKVSSLDDILNVIDHNENIRLSKNLFLSKEVLEKMSHKMDPFKRSRLDYKIQNISMLASDDSIPPLARAITSIKKFNRMSESEIITPSKLCDKMVALLPEEGLREIVANKDKFLDIASKSGEYAVALYKRLTSDLGYKHDQVKNLIYSIPTSSIAYEFTRKFYEILELDPDNIATHFNAYTLIELEDYNKEIDYKKIKNLLTQGKTFSKITVNDKIEEGDKKVKFGAIIGNPPYQKSIGSEQANASLSKQLFPYYVMSSMNISNNYTSLIIPARWFAGNAQDKSFLKLRKFLKDKCNISEMHYYEDSKEVFDDVEIKGGVCYFLSKSTATDIMKFISYHNNKVESTDRKLFLEGLDIILTNKFQFYILKRIKNKNFISLTTITKGRNAFGIIGKNDFVNNISEKNPFKGSCELRCKNNEIRYITEDKVTRNIDLFNNFKVFISKSAGAPHTDRKVIGEPYIGERKTACTDSLIPIGNFDTLQEAENLQKYIKTKFLRFLVSLVKSSQNTTQIVYRFVPMQDFTCKSDIRWKKSIPEIDQQLYKKYGLSQEEIDHIEDSIKDMM